MLMYIEGQNEVRQMKLVRVMIEGFRNIDAVNIRLDNGIMALVAPNGYGKSNVISAIGFAVDFIKADLSSKREKMSRATCIPISREFIGKNFRAAFTFDLSSGDSEYVADYGFEFQWGYDNAAGAIKKEWLDVRGKGRSKRLIKMINREDTALYRSFPTGRCSTAISVDDCELIINKLLREDALYYIDIVKAINSIAVYDHRHDHTDLPESLYELRTGNRKRYSIIENAMTLLFEDIKGLDARKIDIAKQHGVMSSDDSLPVAGNYLYSLYITKRSLNQPVDYRMLSDGERKVLELLAGLAGAESEGRTLISIDEAENSVHPEMIQAYLDVLSQLAGDAAVLITTQSPIVLQYIKTENIYVSAPSDRMAADFRRIDSKKVKQLWKGANDYGESAGMYIFDLLSGSDDELETLRSYLEK